MSRRLTQPVVLMLGALLLAGCGGGVAVGPLGGGPDLPREFHFGVLDFEITSVEGSETNPFAEETAEAAEEGDEPASTFVTMDMTVTNPYAEGGYSIPGDAFSLVFDDHKVTAFEGGFEIAASGKTTTTLGFELDAGEEPSDLVLEVKDRDAEPVVLPLEGEEYVGQASIEYDGATGGGDAAHGVKIAIDVSADAFATLDVQLDEDGAKRGGCVDSSLGRVQQDHALVYLPATVTGNRPTTSSLPSLDFNATNYGVPLKAHDANGVELKICDTFGALDTEKHGDFIVKAPMDTESITITSGCPCGGLLTGNKVENQFFSTEIDVADAMPQLYPSDDE